MTLQYILSKMRAEGITNFSIDIKPIDSLDPALESDIVVVEVRKGESVGQSLELLRALSYVNDGIGCLVDAAIKDLKK